MLSRIVKIYLKSALVLLPFMLIMGSFIVLDPFGVIHNKNPRYETSGDYQATKLYLENTERLNYNSFIFGNSKTLAFRSEDWKKHIENGEYYKFGAPGESIFNIYNKIKLIDEQGDSLKNAIIILDLAMIKNFKNTGSYLQGPVYKHHPYTQDESWMNFYGSFFRYYLADFFFLKVIKDEFSHSANRSSEEDFLKTRKDFNAQTNEFYLSDLENEISQNGFANYYKTHSKEFNVTSGGPSAKTVRLNAEDKKYLFEIKKQFDSDGCAYKIIIGPVLKENNFPGEIVSELKTIFGRDAVYDFSTHSRIANDSTYFYELSHYRPVAGAIMLEEIYSGKTNIKSN